MSKKNTELATRIVKQHAKSFEVEHFDSVHKPTKKDPYNVEAVKAKLPAYAFEVPLLGLPLTTLIGKKSDAQSEYAKYIANMLDSGDLVLSDTWAEDNLED